ncbi:MAG: PRC-barrel domain-containing protein [Candidatus Bathyarchaeia archaeon]
MKYTDLIGKEIFCHGLRVGKIKDLTIDGKEWKITHLEVELRKEAAQEVLGVKSSFKNLLAISAAGAASKALAKDRVTCQVSKGQLRIYLKPS